MEAGDGLFQLSTTLRAIITWTVAPLSCQVAFVHIFLRCSGTESSLAGRVPAPNLLFFSVCTNAPEPWQSFNEDDALTSLSLFCTLTACGRQSCEGFDQGGHICSQELFVEDAEPCGVGWLSERMA